MPSLIEAVRHSHSRSRVVLLSTCFGYWLFYAFSSGIFQTVPAGINAIPILSEEGLSNPHLVGGFTVRSFYYSGLIWYLTGHILVTLLVGMTVFSVVLSILFGLNVVSSTRFKQTLDHAHAQKSSKWLKKFGLAILGLIPALFATGVPTNLSFGTFLLARIFPSSAGAISTVMIQYSLLINSATVALMIFERLSSRELRSYP